MTKDGSKRHGSLTGTVLFSAVIVSLSISFPGGYSVVQINIPQNLILNWIRGIQCSRVGGQMEEAGNYSTSAQETGNQTVLWCSFIPENEVHGQLRNNGQLNVIWALINTAVIVGGGCGVWVANKLVDRMGFRKVFLVANILLTTGIALSAMVAVMGSYEIFIVGRFILGIGTGFGGAMSITYIAEITTARSRGSFGIAPVFSFSTGMLLAAVLSLPQILGTEANWSYLSLIMFAPSVCFFAFYAFIPESPRWMYRRSHDTHNTMVVLQRLRGTPNVQSDMQMIEDEDRAAQQERRKVTISGLFRNGFLRHNLIICSTAMLAQRLTGHAAVYTYSAGIFRQCGLTKAASAYGTIGLLGLQALSAVTGSLLIDKAGRKLLLLVGLFGCAVSLLAMVVFSLLTTHDICTTCRYGSLAALFAFIIFYTSGPAGIPFVLPAEMFDLLTRQSAATVIMLLCQGATAVVAAVFPVMHVYLLEWTFLIFAGITVILGVILALNLMETKGKTFLEIQDALQKRYYERHVRI